MSLTTWLGSLPLFSPSSAPSPSPSSHQTNWADDTFISSDDAEAALCTDRSSFVVRDDIMTLVPGHIKRRMNHPDPSAHITGFQELFIYLNKKSEFNSLASDDRGLFLQFSSITRAPKSVVCDDTNNREHDLMFTCVEQNVVQLPRGLNGDEEPTRSAVPGSLSSVGSPGQAGLAIQDVDENHTNAELPNSGNLVSQFPHMNAPDDGRHKRGPVALDGHVTTEPSLDPATAPQSSQTPIKMSYKNAIAFIRVALQVSVAGLKAAPIPDLDQIPGALLLLIETYEVSHPSILPGVLSDSIT